jgi:DNA invertase Pin-like site-specific DNA recombinase
VISNGSGRVLVWKFYRFARSTRHLLTALEEFDHLGVRFVGVKDQMNTDSPMGRALSIIIEAMAELASSLINRVLYQPILLVSWLALPVKALPP